MKSPLKHLKMEILGNTNNYGRIDKAYHWSCQHHIRMLVHLLAAPFLIQLLAIGLGKVTRWPQ